MHVCMHVGGQEHATLRRLILSHDTTHVPIPLFPTHFTRGKRLLHVRGPLGLGRCSTRLYSSRLYSGYRVVLEEASVVGWGPGVTETGIVWTLLLFVTLSMTDVSEDTRPVSAWDSPTRTM